MSNTNATSQLTGQPPTASSAFFLAELERITQDSQIPTDNKIECIMELATMCFDDAAPNSNVDLIAVDSPVGSCTDSPSMKRKRRGSGEELSSSPTTAADLALTAFGRNAKIRRKGPLSSPSLSTNTWDSNLERTLQNCPEDILICIFEHLDGPTLCKSSLICRRWHSLITHFSTSLWTHLTRTSYSLKTKEELGASWKQFYATHYNIQKGRYTFSSFKENYEISAPSLHPPPPPAEVKKEPKVTRKFIMAWPCDPNNAYIIALDNDKLCWVDADATTVINVADLTPSLMLLQNRNRDIEPLRTLEGHIQPIGLILSNMEGTLVSFDDSSTIMIWNLNTHQFERSINTNEELGFIFSMNIYKRRIVAGGKNGRVVVWNADSGAVEVQLDIPSSYLGSLSVHNLLNVAVWEELVVYGLWDGTFW
ncbi:hypothetical protein HK097_004654, partial [Rhizophlyctis rosea]